MVDNLLPEDESVQYADLNAVADEAIAAEDKPPSDKSAAAETDSQPADDTPDELKGKTPAELAKMYREAQSLIGRQGSELGELRKLADKAIQATLHATQQGRQVPPPKPAPAKQPDAVDFFADPKKATERLIAEHPELKKLRGQAQQFAAIEIQRRKAENQTLFNSEFPDAHDIVADPEFREWVGKSKVRQVLLKRADAMYDLEAAREVLGTWKELKSAKVPAQAANAEAAAANRAANKRAAKVPTGGNASRSEGAGAKIYRRSEVLAMMTEDPAKYDRLADEIALAYAEGRVR